MVGVMPLAIAVGVIGIASLLVVSFWEQAVKRFSFSNKGLERAITAAHIDVRPQDFVLMALAAIAISWVILALVLRLNFVAGIVTLVAVGAIAAGGARLWLRMRANAWQQNFLGQLELVLRMMSSSLRVGLGLRQAMVLVTEELADPARHEFSRVIGESNVGVPLLDALDKLAERIPAGEMQMMSRAIRVQSQTGGDLGQVLENLAGTIRDRRRLQRRIRALTSQGRASGYILVALPIFVGLFVVSTQHQMGAALLFTSIGHMVIGAVVALEIMAGAAIAKILRFDS
ncbi:hypothetical protein EPN42_03680 [bacterium]|nr:MAG: hypothetical protein EPN42_03680 [bacterium]